MARRGFVIGAIDDVDEDYCVDGVDNDKIKIELTELYIKYEINYKEKVAVDLIKLMYEFWRKYIQYFIKPEQIYINEPVARYNIKFKLIELIDNESQYPLIQAKGKIYLFDYNIKFIFVSLSYIYTFKKIRYRGNTFNFNTKIFS